MSNNITGARLKVALRNTQINLPKETFVRSGANVYIPPDRIGVEQIPRIRDVTLSRDTNFLRVTTELGFLTLGCQGGGVFVDLGCTSGGSFLVGLDELVPMKRNEIVSRIRPSDLAWLTHLNGLTDITGDFVRDFAGAAVGNDNKGLLQQSRLN